MSNPSWDVLIDQLPDPEYDPDAVYSPLPGEFGQYTFKDVDDPSNEYDASVFTSRLGPRWTCKGIKGIGVDKYRHDSLDHTIEVEGSEIRISGPKIPDAYMKDLKANLSGHPRMTTVEHIFTVAKDAIGSKPGRTNWYELTYGEDPFDDSE